MNKDIELLVEVAIIFIILYCAKRFQMRVTIQEACSICPYCNIRAVPPLKKSALSRLCENCGKEICREEKKSQ